MGYCIPKIAARFLAAALNAVVFCAWSQPSDQAIIFSTPSSDGVPAATPSLSSKDSHEPVLPGSLWAPDPALDFRATSDWPSPPTATPSASQQQRIKKLLEDRKNWTLMTPAEIFGVVPAAEMLKPAERDAMGREKKPTQLERFLARENALQNSPTNGVRDGRNNSPWNVSRDRAGLSLLDPGDNNTSDAAQKLNQFLNSRPDNEGNSDRRQKSFGLDSFGAPMTPTPAKPDPEQLAAMARFRQFLENSVPPAPASAQGGGFSPVPKTPPLPDPNINQPNYVLNPSGASFTPLTSGIGKPSGLNPLPGITTPAPQPAAAPAWGPQPAPWLSQGPQLNVMPQRKF